MTKERRHVEDGHTPTLESIILKYESGAYDRSADAAIGVLIGTIVELRGVLQELLVVATDSIEGWDEEKRLHEETRQAKDTDA